MVKKISQNEFNEVTASEVAVIDFSATWCGPCKMLAPVLEEVSEEYAGKVNFFNVDVDENPDLAMQYKIMNIPALVVLKKGEKVDTQVGFAPKENIVDALKLEKQLCFPLYAVSKEIVKKYKPFLDELDLTYTQYITMMVMWEHKEMNVKELGEHLYLDSGTLTPVLKKLEQKGWVKRNRAKEDERVLIVTLTTEGEKLRDKAVEIPQKVGGCVCLDQEEAASLYKILYKILGNM